VAQPDDLEVRRDRGEVPDVHGHRVGVVEQPGLRADLPHVVRDAAQYRERAQRPEDPADAHRVADCLTQAVPCGDLEVAHGGRVHADLDRVDDVVRAVQRGPPVEAGPDPRRRVQLPRGVPGDGLGGGQPLRIDVVQRERDVTQFGEAEDAGEQFAGEHDAAGAQEGDHSHARILSVAGSERKRTMLTARLSAYPPGARPQGAAQA
jgi:hypothetical protein